MSSGYDSDTRAHRPKKRKIVLACDVCRRRKVRCDGKQPDGMCTICAVNGWPCSFIKATKKFPVGYVEALETKVRKLENLLHRLHPDDDFSREVGTHLTVDNWNQDGVLGGPELDVPSAFVRAGSKSSHSSRQPSSQPPSIEDEITATVGYSRAPALNEDYEHSDDEDNIGITLDQITHDINLLHVNGFHGKSSGAMLYKAAINTKREVAGVGWKIEEVQRPEYWQMPSWELKTYNAQPAPFDFPDADLIPQLIDSYFQNVNILYPILHRPTFDQHVRDGFHLKNRSFGSVLLMVCANAARFVSDPRVRSDEDKTYLSAGWKWYEQVPEPGRLPVSSSRLFDLQTCCLASIYLSSSNATSGCWKVLGNGIRLAMDIGVHRRRAYQDTPRPEEELYRRCFWVLVYCDRWLSATVGRPCAIQEEDFDLDLPIDCDDEYWITDNPEEAFKQPHGKPSRMTAFIQCLKLSQILGYALRTIYASNKAKAHFGFVGSDWEKRTITNFDSILNQWADSVPDFLRWDSMRGDDILFLQSSHLYAQYYDLQIQIHRPFIHPQKPSREPEFFPSIAICMNAARASSRIVQMAMVRFPGRIMPFYHRPAYVSCIVLMIGLWNAKRSNIVLNSDQDIKHVQHNLDYFRCIEPRCNAAGRVRDVLHWLFMSVDIPVTTNISRGEKRMRPSARDELPTSLAQNSASSTGNDFHGILGQFTDPPTNNVVHPPGDELGGMQTSQSSVDAGLTSSLMPTPFPISPQFYFTGASHPLQPFTFGQQPQQPQQPQPQPLPPQTHNHDIDFGALFGFGAHNPATGMEPQRLPPSPPFDDGGFGFGGFIHNTFQVGGMGGGSGLSSTGDFGYWERSGASEPGSWDWFLPQWSAQGPDGEGASRGGENRYYHTA